MLSSLRFILSKTQNLYRRYTKREILHRRNSIAIKFARNLSRGNLILSLARNNEDNHSVSFRYTKEYKWKQFVKLFKSIISNINLRLSILQNETKNEICNPSSWMIMIRCVNWHRFHQIEIKCVWNENISLSFISLNVGYIIDTNWEWISSTGRQNHQLSACALKAHWNDMIFQNQPQVYSMHIKTCLSIASISCLCSRHKNVDSLIWLT